MNTKRIKTAIGSIALFAVVGASILTSMPNEGKNVKAEGDKYTLSLQGDSVGLNFAAGAGTWGDGSSDGTTLTLETSKTHYFGDAGYTKFSAGDTIIFSFDVKTSQTTAFKLGAINDGSTWIDISNTGDTPINAPEYTHFDYAYTCKTNPSDGFHYFGFKVTWAGTVYFQNIYIYKTTSIEVNAGEAIGETLPEVGEKNGLKGYWAIDGERINSTTIYNYGMNKFAMKKYARNVYLRGESTGVNFTANTLGNSTMWGGWNRDSSDNSWIIPADKVAVFFGTESTAFSEGDEILISFDLKATGSVYLNLQVQLPEWSLFNSSWYTNEKYAHFDIYFKIPTTYEKYSFYFQNAQSGTANIKNLVISKPTVLTLDEGEVLGSLPTGVGNWYYNGTVVDETSILDFSTLGDKKAVLYSDIDNVRNFVTDYMHLGDANYQGENVNGGHCIGDGTYAKAKEAYNKMNSTNKQLFNSVKEFNEAKERLSKWATANKDVLEDNNLVALSKIAASYSIENNFVVISIVSLVILITSTLIFFKRKKA